MIIKNYNSTQSLSNYTLGGAYTFYVHNLNLDRLTSANEETVKKAHEHGILCNVFWSDDPEETKKFREMGIDTILTNDYHLISQVVER